MACFGYDSLKNYMNRRLKSYGAEYFAKRNKDGILCVFRKRRRSEPVWVEEGFTLYDVIDSPEFIFALTDNWKTNGVPREWGADIVLSRLKETDYWLNPHMLEEMEAQNAKVDEAKARDLRNHTEAFLSDNHSKFKKAFDGVNTGGLSKREKRKENLDKRRF